jgi:hypothetical protein
MRVYSRFVEERRGEGGEERERLILCLLMFF